MSKTNFFTVFLLKTTCNEFFQFLRKIKEKPDAAKGQVILKANFHALI